MAGNKSRTFENSVLKLVFNNDAIATVGDASGLQPSAADGNFYFRLFTTATNDETTVGTEASYTGYDKVTVARTTGGFTVTVSVVTNAALLSFGECSSGPETLRYWGLFTDATIKTEAYRPYWGQLPTDIDVVVGLNPTVPIGYLTINEN